MTADDTVSAGVSRSFVRDLPCTDQYTQLLGGPESRALHSGLVTLQQGEDCGWHSTGNHEEMIICLEGAGELASEDGLRLALAAGQYGFNPPHTRHCVFNTSGTPMRYVYVVAPAGAPAPDTNHPGST